MVLWNFHMQEVETEIEGQKDAMEAFSEEEEEFVEGDEEEDDEVCSPLQ